MMQNTPANEILSPDGDIDDIAQHKVNIHAATDA